MRGDNFRAWAIDTKSKEGHGLIGRYYWGSPMPPHMEGCSIALFKTKRIAEQHLPEVRQTFEKAQVIRVALIIKPIKGGIDVK